MRLPSTLPNGLSDDSGQPPFGFFNRLRTFGNIINNVKNRTYRWYRYF